MCTHGEFIEIVGIKEADRCNAAQMTFGGRCLNCGYNPDRFESMTKEEAANYYSENSDILTRHMTF